MIKKFQNDIMQLENKLEKIQNEALKPQETKTQLSTHINAKKMTLVKDNDIVKIPYRHPNHKSHFDQRQDQNVHKQRGYDVKCEGTQNLQPKQKTRSFIQQGDQ